MNYIFRAIKSLKERIGKTLIILAVMLTVCVVILSGFSIQSATGQAAILARQKLGATVSLTVDQEKLMQAQNSEGGGRVKLQQTPIPLEYLQELKSNNYVVDYSVTTSTNVNIDNIDPVGLEETEETEETNETENNKQNSNGNKMSSMSLGDFSLVGVDQFDSNSLVLSGENTLIEGRELTEEDLNSNVVIIEETFAKENELEVGSKLTLVNSSDETITVEVEIVGIYKSTEEISEMAYRMTSMLPYNKIYCPYTLANEFKGESYENAVDSMVFYLNDPINVEAFIEEANTSSIDFNTFKLDANNSAYETMMGPIENVASFSKTTLILVTIFGVVILALIIMLSIKDRTNEIGILMALGEKRGKIVLQLLSEVIIVLLISIGISGIFGNQISNTVGNKLVQNEIVSQEEDLSEGINVGVKPNRGGNSMTGNSANVEAIDSLDININFEDFSKMTMLSILLAVVATLIPSISIMRLNPKTILSKHN